MDSHIPPSTDARQRLGPWGEAGGLRWPNVVVSGQVAERALRARSGGKPRVKKYTILNHELISNLYGYDSTTRDTRALPARAVTSVDLSSKLDFILHSTRKLFKLKTINWDVVSRQILVSRMCVTAVDPRWPALG